MKSLPLSLLVLAAAACEMEEEAAREETPAVEGAGATTFPTAEEIALACDQEAWRQRRDAQEAGAIIDPSFEEYPVRNPRCRWVDRADSRVICEFEQATIWTQMPTPEERREAVERMREGDWKPYRANFHYAGTGWVATGCQRIESETAP